MWKQLIETEWDGFTEKSIFVQAQYITCLKKIIDAELKYQKLLILTCNRSKQTNKKNKLRTSLINYFSIDLQYLQTFLPSVGHYFLLFMWNMNFTGKNTARIVLFEALLPHQSGKNYNYFSETKWRKKKASNIARRS